MSAVLAFSLTLLAGVLLCEVARRSVISTAVLFLVVGFALGEAWLEVVQIETDTAVLERLVEVTLVAILFSDGARVGLRELREAWHLPGRALVLGMPLMWAGTALLGRWLMGLGWGEACLVAAVLMPTDPVFAAALVGRREVPLALRRLLNVESGLNDGLALPVVLITLAIVTGREVAPGELAGELVLGLALGAIIALGSLWLADRSFLGRDEGHDPLLMVAIPTLTYAVAHLLHGNAFLAAFAGGVTVASWREAPHEQLLGPLGEGISELLKLGALFLFGALITPDFFRDVGWSGLLFVAALLLVVRPASLTVSLLGSGLGWPERLAAAWFGPRGFASVVYGLLVLRAVGGERGAYLFHVIAVTVVASIVLHSSSDVLVARRVEEEGRPRESAG